MALLFNNTVSQDSVHNSMLTHLGAVLSNSDLARLRKIKRNWNFWEGYHWEGMPETDKPQVTINYVRAFVDKFVSFEMGEGFNIKMLPEVENLDGGHDPLNFLNNVWEYNNKAEKCVELGQSKSVTGDGWFQVSFDDPKDPDYYDPFGEYDNGRIRLTVLPTAIVFPKYNDMHNKDMLESLTIQYPIYKSVAGHFGTAKFKNVLYKQIWTREKVEVYEGKELVAEMENKWGIIPFRQIKNYPQQGKTEGVSDIEDIIPINMELNLKKSDISEIIDYHSAPVTLVFGARVGQLERGANKVWGGLPKDAKVENLRLEGDLTTAHNYTETLKKEMHEVGSIPEGVLGGSLAISNTSGIALQISMKPILDRVKIKQVMTKEGLEEINKMILLIAEKEGMIEFPSEDVISRKKLFHNEVTFDSPLPKDSLLELQELELEMRMGLESREGAMKRTGKDNIQERIKAIDDDMAKNPSLYGKEDIEEQITLMKEQSKIQGNTVIPTTTTKKVGTNSEGKPKQVNAGYQNSPEPKR